MITVKEEDRSCFTVYDSIPMNVEVVSEYRIKRVNNGLGGMLFEEVPVKAYVKDLSVYERAVEYEKTFDISNWRFYIAYEDGKPIGAMTVAGTTKDLNMLCGRDDACVLWDIRVDDDHKHMGVGQMLMDAGTANAKKDGYTQMIIECQNNNVPACNFYKKQGAKLGKIDMYAYYDEPDVRDEVQFIWYFEL